MSMVLYNLRPQSHTSSIPVKTVCLLSYMLDEVSVDIARVIANELKMADLSGTLHGDRTLCQLTYSGLIIGLCKKEKVQILADGHVTIKGMIND
ncbi:hypothetical protein RYX36_009341 [Vicia faba]